MAYIPREIKDRVAVGDDIFIVEDLGDNRVRLIPAPTHVLEVGTPVNKALLQPMENHMGDVANPHATTKAQVGLGNVDNVKQASKSEFDAHESDASAHHERYTDAEAIAAVWGAAGAGSGLDADKLDGYDADKGTRASTIPVRDKTGKLPGSITGDAATVGGKRASDFLTVSGGNPTGTLNFNVNPNARIVVPVGTDKWAT